MINRILVPLDGSGLAERALPLAWGIASRTSSELLLLSAVVPHEPWAGPAVSNSDDSAEKAAATEYLEEVAERLRTPKQKVRTLAVSDRAVPAICSAAEAFGSGIIVMATHGRSGADRWYVGSVAERVRHASHVPVLLVPAARETIPQAATMEKILVPLDGSKQAEKVLPLAMELAEAVAATVVLQQVVASLDDHEEDANKYLSTIAREFAAKGIDVETRVDHGLPTQTILEYSDGGNIDLIAMTTHGKSGGTRFVLGSVADAVTRTVETPCLIVRSRNGAGAIDQRLGNELLNRAANPEGSAR